MFKLPYLNFDLLVKRNYKDLFIDFFHGYLNKVMTIAVEDRDKHMFSQVL